MTIRLTQPAALGLFKIQEVFRFSTKNKAICFALRGYCKLSERNAELESENRSLKARNAQLEEIISNVAGQLDKLYDPLPFKIPE